MLVSLDSKQVLKMNALRYCPECSTYCNTPPKGWLPFLAGLTLNIVTWAWNHRLDWIHYCWKRTLYGIKSLWLKPHFAEVLKTHLFLFKVLPIVKWPALCFAACFPGVGGLALDMYKINLCTFCLFICCDVRESERSYQNKA